MEGRNGFSMSTGRESILRFSDETIRTAIAFSSNGLDYADAVIHSNGSKRRSLLKPPTASDSTFLKHSFYLEENGALVDALRRGRFTYLPTYSPRLRSRENTFLDK